MTNKAGSRPGKYTVFVLMSFREEYDDVYLVIKDAAQAASEVLGTSITCFRADEISKPGLIPDQIMDSIRQADLIIADVSDRNPNVMYELGLAHSLGKPAILIAQEVTNSPFDVRNFRTIFYDRTRLAKDLRGRLIELITSFVENGFGGYAGLVGPATAVNEHPKLERNRVFISYSHADSDILKRVLIHLKPLEKQGVIDLWVDTRIKAGERWEDRITAALASAKVAILLISADFLASDFIVENELPPLLAAAEQDGTKIIPVIVKPSRFLRDKNLAIFQALNDPTRPVIKMDQVEQEELFVRLAEIVEFYHK